MADAAFSRNVQIVLNVNYGQARLNVLVSNITAGKDPALEARHAGGRTEEVVVEYGLISRRFDGQIETGSAIPVNPKGVSWEMNLPIARTGAFWHPRDDLAPGLCSDAQCLELVEREYGPPLAGEVAVFPP